MQIEIRALNKSYRGGVQALADIDLTIPNGMFGLLGPNGAGKTTLMRILAGILRPTSGSLRIGSYDTTTERGRTAIKRILGYLPQELGVYPDLTAYEFLDYFAILKGLNNRTARRRRILELLEMVALTDVAWRKLKTFSSGMKRCVGIAQALLNNPELLIVDEPTVGLDPEARIHFRNLLSDLGGDRIVLLSTHIVEDIAQTCQNIAVMQQGRIIFHGPLSDLVSATAGKVWNVTTPGPRPSGVTVVSIMNMGATIQYRVVSQSQPGENAVSAAPGLEDGYIWLMHEQHPSTLVGDHSRTEANCCVSQ